MTRHSRSERTLTELDYIRLVRCLQHLQADAHGHAHDEAFAEMLDVANVVPGPEMPPDVVTMYSQVLVQELPDGALHKFTLCYPDTAEPAEGFVSVLSPVGRALIGLPVGAVTRWQLPDGREVEARLLSIVFQPEASGDYTS